jgi:hypothetical protein
MTHTHTELNWPHNMALAVAHRCDGRHNRVEFCLAGFQLLGGEPYEAVKHSAYAAVAADVLGIDRAQEPCFDRDIRYPALGIY